MTPLFTKLLAPLLLFLQGWAIDLEVMDPREKKYTFTDVAALPIDARIIWVRLADLADAPPFQDHRWFPPRESSREMLEANRKYREHLDRCLAVERNFDWILLEAKAEAERLNAIWDAAHDVNCEYFYVTHRRAALKKLRELLGAADYFAGRLPPPVPLWRFERVD